MMKNAIYTFVVFLIAAFCLTNPAFATAHHQKPKAGHHAASKGKHLVGGHGSSHKGGHYAKS